MSFLRTLAVIALVTIFCAAGAMKIQEPAGTAKQIMSGQLPWVLEQLQVAKHVPGFKFTIKEATLLAQAVGGAMVGCSLFMIVNLGRQFFAFLLALVLIAITACQHVNLKDPKKTEMSEQIQAMKNLSIVGGLLYIAFNDESAQYRSSSSSSRSTTNKVKTA